MDKDQDRRGIYSAPAPLFGSGIHRVWQLGGLLVATKPLSWKLGGALLLVRAAPAREGKGNHELHRGRAIYGCLKAGYLRAYCHSEFDKRENYGNRFRAGRRRQPFVCRTSAGCRNWRSTRGNVQRQLKRRPGIDRNLFGRQSL